MAKEGKKKGSCLKTILIVIVAIVVLAVIGSIIGGDDKVKDVTDQKETTNNNENSEKNSETESEEKTEFAIGEVAEYKGVQTSVLSYEESSGNDWGSPKEGNVFVFVNIEIANNSDEEISVSSMASFDNYCDSYALDYSSEALMAASVDNRQQLDGSIASGMKLNGWLGLEVPANWKEIQIHYKDNVFLDSNYKFIITK